MGTGNIIHETAVIPANITLGNYNVIGKNVQIKYLGDEQPLINIGDNNIINDNTRILVGGEGVIIGDWNVFHNDMLLIGGQKIEIGHNCWFGQNTILDGSGGLHIHNGVRIGMYSQIWTHVASGELIEGCLLYGNRPTIIEDDVWLVGSCIVSSGITLGKKSIFLINSVVTKSAEPGKVYVGSPAQVKENLNFWKKVTIEEKLEMILGWANDYCTKNTDNTIDAKTSEGYFIIKNDKTGESILITINTQNLSHDLKNTTVFNLEDKTFNKNNTALERGFYKYIYNHKARFIPV